MPQPLSRFDPKLGFVLASGNSPHDPQMAQSVLTVINLWSQIDYNYGYILARIAKADPETITAVFQAMISGEARKGALFAAAKVQLSAEQAALVMAVVESTKVSRKTRNEFAHHLWGSLNSRPDCVVLAHPKDLAAYTAKMVALSGTRKERPELDRSQIMVWRQPCFDEAVAAAKTAHQRTVELSFIFDHPAEDRMRQDLLQHPQIARLYAHHLQEIQSG